MLYALIRVQLRTRRILLAATDLTAVTAVYASVSALTDNC